MACPLEELQILTFSKPSICQFLPSVNFSQTFNDFRCEGMDPFLVIFLSTSRKS